MNTIGKSIAKAAKECIEKDENRKKEERKTFFTDLKRHVTAKADKFQGMNPKIVLSFINPISDYVNNSSMNGIIPPSVIFDVRRYKNDFTDTSKEIEDLFQWCKSEKITVTIEEDTVCSGHAVKFTFAPIEEVLHRNGLKSS